MFDLRRGQSAPADTADGAAAGNQFMPDEAEPRLGHPVLGRRARERTRHLDRGIPTKRLVSGHCSLDRSGGSVQQRVYPDPGVGMNLRTIPGTTYPIFTPFTDLQMPPESPFRHSWWYRTEFKLPAEHKGETLWLGFDGVNYRANVWMNRSE